MRIWIKNNKFATGFIVATIVVALVLGVWAGVSYLSFEDYHLSPVSELRERTATDGIVYHHTAVSDRPITDHHRFHLTRGWLMVGYHYHIRTDGAIEIGRHHSTVGAHAGAAINGRSIGVAFSGNMEHYPPTPEQYESAIELQYWLETEAGYGELEVWGHNEWMATCCPGKHVDLNVVRDGVTKLRAEGRIEPVSPEFKNLDVEVLTGFVKGAPIEGYLVIEEGRVYIPVRYVSEELGYDVSWDPERRVWIVQ